MAELVRGQRRRPRGSQLRGDGGSDLGLGQPGGEPQGRRLAQALPGLILEAGPADDGRPRGDSHAAVTALLEHAFPFEIAIGASHRLRVREQLLGQRSVLRQGRTGLERPGGDQPTQLPGDLRVNRHRGIVLDIEHAVDATAVGTGIQPGGRIGSA